MIQHQRQKLPNKEVAVVTSTPFIIHRNKRSTWKVVLVVTQVIRVRIK